MGKVQVTLIVKQSEISREVKDPLVFVLDEGATIIDVINLADREILKAGKFPVKGYKSLLQMVYHPFENRFYEQVAVQGYTSPGSFLNLRENPRKPLPNSVTIVLVPEGPCISGWEKTVDI